MKRFLKYLYYCALTFCSLFAVYYITTPKAEDSAFFFYYKTFLGAAFITPLPFFINTTLKWDSIICETYIGILWIITTPFFHRFALGSANLVDDIAAGACVFSLLIMLKWFLHRYFHKKLANILVFIMQLTALIPPLLNSVYFIVYKKPIGINAMLAIMQTNPSEAKEFFLSTPLYYNILFLLILILQILLFKKQSYSKDTVYSYNELPLSKIAIFIVLLPSIALLTFFKVFINTKVIDNAYQAHNYFTSIACYSEKRIELLKNLQITTNNTIKTPHTIILVIGESASRDYMHAFTPMEDNTTPWLSQHKSDFILFPNAYSCAYSTVISLQHALTSANFYNLKPFIDCLSIIDIAKATGYKTYWFSNQGKISKFDTPITLIAEQCDISHWLRSDEKYDGKLLDQLKKVDPTEKNFIVFHLMGSHAFYSSRYPKKFQIWTNPNRTGGVEDYKNSILYTDKVLQEIFEYSQKNMQLASFVYCSDHGTDPTTLRDPDSSDFKNLRIPMFAYMSYTYKEVNPELTSILRHNKDMPVSNDLLYNLLCSILGVSSNHFEEDESIASPKYKYNYSNLKTDLGKQLVRNDPVYSKNF